MGAAASARMHTVLDSSGTRLIKKKKKVCVYLQLPPTATTRTTTSRNTKKTKKKEEKKKVLKKLKHITVTTESKCRLFLAAQLFFLGIHSTRKQVRLATSVAVRCNTETSPPDASGVAGQELAQGCPLLVSFGTAGNKQFVDPLL